MKLAKKILVGILALTVLVSAFVLSTSAEATVTINDINAVFDYKIYDTYLIEKFDYEAGNYELGVESDFKYYTQSAVSQVVEGENKYLGITYTPAPPAAEEGGEGEVAPLNVEEDSFVRLGEFRMEGYAKLPKNVVADFNVSFGDSEGKNGAKITFSITYSKGEGFEYPDEVVIVSIDALDSSSVKVTYPVYDARTGVYSEKTDVVALNMKAWYNVEVVMDNLNGKYSLNIKNGDASLFSVADIALAFPKTTDGVVAGIDSINLAAIAKKDTPANVSLDTVLIYEGTLIRDVENADVALADLILAIDALAKSEGLSLDDRIKVTDVYERLFIEAENPAHLYTLPEDETVLGAEKHAAVKAVVDGVKAYVNKTDVLALIAYTEELAGIAGYYEKIEYAENSVAPYYDVLKSADLATLEGMADAYAENVTYAKAAEAAILKYEAIIENIEVSEIYTIDFVSKLEEAYDPMSKDYAHMVKMRNTLEIFVDYFVPEYKYGDYKLKQWIEKNGIDNMPTIAELTDYEVASGAFEVYEELIQKIEEIEANVAVFEPAVLDMKIEKEAAVSEAAPYLTKNFEELYAYYTTAKSVYIAGAYEYGTVHEQLDPATYNKGTTNLLACLEKFFSEAQYIEARVAESEAFVNAISGAQATNYYITLVSQLDFAAKYLDADIEYSLEKHTGVADSITAYYELRTKAQKMYNDAITYIAAVNEINLDADYKTLKSKVEAAALLRENGAVVGIEGVESAEVKFIIAQSKLDAAAANSSTLINAVNELKAATSLAERRRLIAIANSVKNNAEDAIEGVTEAKIELASQIASYNANVKAANAEYAAAHNNAFSVSASVAPVEALYKAQDVAAKIFN